jgi:uncharacterized membrane protein YkoI
MNSATTEHLRKTGKNMKLIYRIRSVACLVLLAGFLNGCVTANQTPELLQAQAKLTRGEAEKIALAKVPNGTIKEGELERENGKIIWSFDIATPGTSDITEVQVDALTGDLVAMEKETPAQQAKESKKEAAEKPK